MKAAGSWLLLLFSNHERSLAVLMGIIFKDVEQEPASPGLHGSSASGVVRDIFN